MFVGVIKGLNQNNKPYELEIARTGESSNLYIENKPIKFQEAHAHFSYNQNNWLWIDGKKHSITEAKLETSELFFILEFGGFNQSLLFKDEPLLGVEFFDVYIKINGDNHIELKMLMS